MSDRHPLRRLVLLVVALLPLFATPPASAQRLGRVPDPLASAMIDRYAERLELTDGQRRGLLDLHARYRETYAALREGPIAAYAREHADSASWSQTPEKAQAAADAHAEVVRRVREADEALFDAMAPLLTESQATRLDTLRLARERERILQSYASVRWIVPSTQADIASLVDELGLLPADRAAAAPVLDAYAAEMTTAVRRLRKVAADQPVAQARARVALMEEQQSIIAMMQGTGVTGDMTPEERERVAKEHEEQMREAQERMRDLSARMIGRAASRRRTRPAPAVLPPRVPRAPGSSPPAGPPSHGGDEGRRDRRRDARPSSGGADGRRARDRSDPRADDGRDRRPASHGPPRIRRGPARRRAGDVRAEDGGPAPSVAQRER
jgi:hypothetical protein